MNLLINLGTPVLLYHSTYDEVPAELVSRIHNVAPDKLVAHLEYLRQHVEFVPIDELAAARNSRGLAAVTFDDGYKCVLDTMASVLIDMQIPFTVFVNAATLEGKPLWRDKIRAIIGSGMVSECEASFVQTKKIPGQTFYGYTKDPRNDSRIVDQEISRFLESRPTPACNGCFTLDSPSLFLDHPLVTYGNHSHNHYVLSSLPVSEQREQIVRTGEALASIPNIRTSRVFAMPFGEPQDYTEDTLAILLELGYIGVLLSRQRLNLRRRRSQGIRLIERFMPDDSPLSRQLHRVKRLALA